MCDVLNYWYFFKDFRIISQIFYISSSDPLLISFSFVFTDVFFRMFMLLFVRTVKRDREEWRNTCSQCWCLIFSSKKLTKHGQRWGVCLSVLDLRSDLQLSSLGKENSCGSVLGRSLKNKCDIKPLLNRKVKCQMSVWWTEMFPGTKSSSDMKVLTWANLSMSDL